MSRRLTTLLALLAALLIAPTAASAAAPKAQPWVGAASLTTIQTADDGDTADDADQDTDDPADATDDPSTVDDDPVDSDDGTLSDDDDSADADEDDVVDGVGTSTDDTVDPAVLVPLPSSSRTVKGRVARLRTDGRVAIPRSAPKAVKRVLAAANLIVGKPYKKGGGHAKLADSGYDCSGAVSYALIRAGLLPSPLVSGGFARFAVKGAGRWITIQATAGHVYMEIAGIRLDTSRVGDPKGRAGVRWRPVIGRRAGFHTRHIKGL